MICVTIDEMVPCLKNTISGDIVRTEVIRIRRKSFLKKFNKANGWYVNWEDLVPHNEVYALVLEGTTDIQGLVALKANPDYGAVYISWAVASPQNNPELVDQKRYIGVGGHLLAIAIDRSEQVGYRGDVTGFCRTERIMNHFVDQYGADPICLLHQYQIGIYDETARKIREVYDYEWSDDEI